MISCIRTVVCGLAALLALLLAPGAAGDQVQKTGDVLRVAVPVAALIASQLVEDDSTGSFQLAKSMIASQLVTYGLKHAIDKQRPDGECCKSFPSAHSSIAFAGTVFIHRRYGWKWAIPAYLASGFVMYSRVHGNEHHVEDVLAGAAIGAAGSFAFTRRYQGVRVEMVSDGEMQGLRISKVF